MGWVRGKLGGPYALFVHHSGQRHSDGSHARKFSPLRRSLNCSQQTTIFCVLEKKHLLTGIRAASSSPQISDKVLKPFLSIFGDRIFDSNVDRGMPNLAAAPLGPNIRPRLSFRAASIMSFSCSSSLRGRSIWFFGFAVRNGSGCRGNQLSSIVKISVSQSITEHSMTFCSSRMFPGQGYD